MSFVEDRITVSSIIVDCVVGVRPEERIKLQPVIVALTLFLDTSECGRSDDLNETVDYSALAKRAARVCREAQAYTLEALASLLARASLYSPGFERVQRVLVRLDKPEAMKLGKPSIEIERSRNFFKGKEAEPFILPPLSPIASVTTTSDSEQGDIVYLGLGSNQGPRANLIQTALNLLQDTGYLGEGKFVRLLNTSFMYETPPAYVLDQPSFLNAAAKVCTNLSAIELLDHIKERVEKKLGRLLEGEEGASPRFGPRCIDVDILFFGPHQSINVCGSETQRDLIIPHPRITERDFALGPLCDMAPALVHPQFGISVLELFRRLPSVSLQRLTPCCNCGLGGGQMSTSLLSNSELKIKSDEKYLKLGKQSKTLVMGVLNVTPDSFSDGGSFVFVEAALSQAKAMLLSGVSIIDVGGQSTRPGAELVSAEEESARVLPVLKALRKELGESCPILSVDTFYAQVAESAVTLQGGGADIVNDVSGGTMDNNMLPLVARLGVPIILMHMRGTPQTMASFATYASTPSSSSSSSSSLQQQTPILSVESPSSSTDIAESKAVVDIVRSELLVRVQSALNAGINRWNIILDPGLGFAKTPVHSVALLRASSVLFSPPSDALLANIPMPAKPPYDLNLWSEKGNFSFPTLYGPSRKGFIGLSSGKSNPKDRDWGTAAAVTASIALGASIVRVHNVEALHDVVKVSDAIYRML
jgi:dihydroneopterin aldolase/2-amino-4-hydroxy-6-hydroxymethyldihydropteridine diphosphokinase/dihydropteroate synthase